MLPIRPDFNDDECLLGYLMRVAYLNGFKFTGNLLNYAGLGWHNNRMPVHDILTGKLNLSRFFYRLGLKWKLPRSVSVFRKFTPSIDTNSIFSNHPRVCYLCIAKYGYFKCQWTFLPVITCNEHHTLLFDLDIQTGRRLNWNDTSIMNVDLNCNCDIDSVKIKRMSKLSAFFEDHFNGRINKNDCPILFNDLGVNDCLTIVNFLSHYITNIVGDDFHPVSMRNDLVAPVYEDAWRMVSTWPDGFYSLLSQYISRPMSKRGHSGIQKNYRDLYEQLYLRRKSAGIMRVKSEFECYINTYWPGTLPATRISRIKIHSSKNIISKKVAAKILDVRLPRFDKLINQNRIELFIFQGKGHYLRDQIELLACQYNDNWSLSQASEALCLTKYHIKALLKYQFINFIQQPDMMNRDWLIDKSSCERLINRLSLLANEPECHTGGKSMAGIQREGYSLTELVTGMLEGGVIFLFKYNNKSPFSFKQFHSFKVTNSSGKVD